MTDGQAEQITQPSNHEAGLLFSEFWERGYDYKRPKRGDLVMGTILEVTSQSILVDIGAKRDGVVPSHDLDRLESDTLGQMAVGDEVPVYVLRTKNLAGDLILSLSKGREMDDWKEAQRLLEADEIIEQQVSGYNRGGVTVSFGQLTAFVPASHLTGFARNLSDDDKDQWLAEKRGQVIRAKFLEVDQSKRRLVLSQRKAEQVYRQQRREELLETLNVGDIVSGKVSALTNFGAFIDIGGADGLLHVSQITDDHIADPSEVLEMGQEVRVKVLKLDRQRQRIGLGMKQLQPSPWDDIYSHLFAGQVIPVTIINIADFGAFARIGPGLVGLIHTSRLSHHSIQHPTEVVTSGDQLNARVIGIDAGRRRIALSLLDITEEDLETAEEEIEEVAPETEIAETEE